MVAARAESELPPGLRDSKLLSKQQRIELLNKLSNCCSFGEGWVEATEIDRFGLAEALRLGVARALGKLSAEVDEEIIMDGNSNYVPARFLNSKTLIKADNLVPIVSAASVYAKVNRDYYMSKLALAHPQYGFDKHVGYGTKQHINALTDYGVIKTIHRLSFAPIAKIMA